MGTMRTQFVSAALSAVIVGGMSIGPARGGTIVMSIATHARISDGGGQTRILVDPGDLTTLAGKKVLYARMRLNLATDTCADGFNDIEICPVTTPWSPLSVSWSSPWDSAGGDIETKHRRTVSFETGGGELTEVLLTDLVQAWADGRLDNLGLELIRRTAGCAYRLVHDARLAYGELVVRCVNQVASTGGE